MTSLTELTFGCHSIDKSCTDRFSNVLEQYGSSFLPQLQVLDMRNAFKDADSAQRFFGCVGKQGGFASVKELRLGKESHTYHRYPMVSFCPSVVFTEGAFTGFQRLILREMILPPNSLAALCRALEQSPCVKNLKLLELQACDVPGAGLEALGGLFAKSLLPSLQKLNLNGNPGIKDAGLVRLAEAVKVGGAHAAPALKKLLLSNTGIGPVGLNSLMSAVEMACFPVLEELDLSYSAKFDSAKEADEFAASILMHCPHLAKLTLPAKPGTGAMQVNQGGKGKAKKLNVPIRR
jgi:hypothetical protein